MWAEVEPGDDADQCILALQGQTREAVKREYRRLKGTVGPGEQVTTKAQIGEPVPAAS
jgi:hypothetical protein